MQMADKVALSTGSAQLPSPDSCQIPFAVCAGGRERMLRSRKEEVWGVKPTRVATKFQMKMLSFCALNYVYLMALLLCVQNDYPT